MVHLTATINQKGCSYQHERFELSNNIHEICEGGAVISDCWCCNCCCCCSCCLCFSRCISSDSRWNCVSHMASLPIVADRCLYLECVTILIFTQETRNREITIHTMITILWSQFSQLCELHPSALEFVCQDITLLLSLHGCAAVLQWCATLGSTDAMLFPRNISTLPNKNGYLGCASE